MKYKDVYTVNNKYIVLFEDLTKNKLDIDGWELEIDPRFNRQHHAMEQGVVAAAPEEDEIKVGDTVVCQYLVVEENNRLEQTVDGYYQIADRDMIFAVLRGMEKEIIMLDKFILVKPEETGESDYEEVGGMMLPKQETKGNETTATVTHVGSDVTNVEVGDRVKLHKSAQYPLTIDGERYYRVRSDVGIIFKYKK